MKLNSGVARRVLANCVLLSPLRVPSGLSVRKRLRCFPVYLDRSLLGQQSQLLPSHTESVTSFQETGKALHLWMQAWPDEGETMLVSVESTDKFDNSTPL